MMRLRWGLVRPMATADGAITCENAQRTTKYTILSSSLCFLLFSFLSSFFILYFTLLYTTLSLPSTFLFMPHADSDKMGEPIVNGEKVHSQFFDVCNSSSHTIHFNSVPPAYTNITLLLYSISPHTPLSQTPSPSSRAILTAPSLSISPIKATPV